MAKFRVNLCPILLVLLMMPCSPASASSSDDSLELEIQPAGWSEVQAESFTRDFLERPEVKDLLNTHKHHILSSEFHPSANSHKDSTPLSDPQHLTLQIYDYTRDSLWELTGRLEDGSSVLIRPSPKRLDQTDIEFQDALEQLQRHPEFGADLSSGRLQAYPAMPPTLSSPSCGRLVPVGLQPIANTLRRHEIVGVNLADGSVLRYPSGAPPTTIAAPTSCGAPSANQGVTRRGTPGTAVVTVRDGSDALWSMTVTRPAASSGARGSGVEIKDVRYRGKLVFSRAHVPILTVDYDRNACGPYRDWQWAENAFNASGTSLASGILRASTRPTTIYDTRQDRGNFRGVAVFMDGGELVLTSELSAAWYRYVSEFRFARDGTIRPVFKFSAVSNSCVCRTHTHHVYWRFDFDILQRSPNRIEALEGGNWRTLRNEEKFRRTGPARTWRVRHGSTNAGYTISPGSNDGTANSYGQGDAWALRYRSNEIDDARVRRSTAANLDAFLTREPVFDQDLVFWYAGHFRHAQGSQTPHLIGPTLRPFGY